MIYLTGSALPEKSHPVLLTSATVGQQTEASCFSFWYHMFGGDGVELELYLKKSVQSAGAPWKSDKLFSHNDRTTADRWYNVRRTVFIDEARNEFVFALRATRENAHTAVVALGPLEFSHGPCDVLTDSEGYCDFEVDECGWTSDTVWKRGVKLFSYDDPGHHVRSGPVNSAYVMMAAMTSYTKKVATLISPEFPGQSEPQCLEFWYLETGSGEVPMQAEILVKGESELIWTKPSFSKDDWMLVRVQFVQDKKFQVVLRATMPANSMVSLSLDNVAVRTEPCVHPIECDFSEGLCGYINRFEGDFRWLVGSGRLENPRMQPKSPVPQGKFFKVSLSAFSSFTYLDLTTGTGANSTEAKITKINVVGLLSPVFNVTDEETAIIVEYYRNGPDILVANFTITCYGDGKPVKAQAQFSVGMPEVFEWNTLNVTLKQATNCQLSLRVTRGYGTNGAIAIGKIRTKSAVTEVPNSDSANLCTFEDGSMCGWQSKSSALAWTLNDPSKKSARLPTIRPHTSSVQRSPMLKLIAAGGACFSFWYFSVHDKHSEISVFMGEEELFYTITRTGHRWEHTLANFTIPEGSFELEIRASIKRGMLALDDLQLTAGPCPQRDFCSWEWATLEGTYLYLNTTALNSHHPMARLIMSTRQPTEATCITFWWKGKGARSQLNVYRYSKETSYRDPLLSMRTDDEGDWWNARSVTVSSKSYWRLVFEVVAPAGEKRQSGVMIDDIEYTDGKCPPYNLCTFEEECLPWRIPTEGSESKFEVERAGSFSQVLKDHTTSTEDGYYLLYRSPGNEGNPCCFTPKSSLGGENSWNQGKFFFTRARQPSIEAISGSNADGFLAIDDVLIDTTGCEDTSRQPSREFQCGDGETVPRDRVCDFVPDCDNRADESSCGDCDFSEGACGWNLDDARNRGTTVWQVVPIGLVSRSPPNGADQRRDGNYLLLYGNSTMTLQHGRASIQSPTIRNTGKLCALVFWYNFHRAHLDVDLYMNAAGYTMQVWTRTALGKPSLEGFWNRVSVDIGRHKGEVSFDFATNQYPQGKAVFAVDSIHYSGCTLPTQAGNCTDKLKFHCGNGVCIDSYERCNYVDDCGDNSDENDCGDYRMGCNFDSSFCDWLPQAPSEGKGFGWELSSPSSMLSRGPTRDHTTGTQKGKFIILHSTLSEKTATIVGPALRNVDHCSISFFYTVQGESEPQLSLNVRTSKNGPWKRVWSQPRPTTFWNFMPETVAFTEKEPFQIAFIGEHRRSRKSGYVAIDDVTFSEDCEPYHKALPEASTPAPPAFTCDVSEYQCGDSKQCIRKSQVCDFKNDCSNEADEAECGACDEFTKGLCGLENEKSNERFGWKRTTARGTKLNGLFPSSDSKLNPDGAYAAYSLLNADAPAPSSAISMVTPPLGHIAHSCVVNFYAYVANDLSSVLTFGVLATSGPGNLSRDVFELAQLRGNSNKSRWTELSVKIGNWHAGSRLFYRASSVGVSVDRPKYINCHPDTQSEGSVLTEQVSCDFSNPKSCGWFPERQAADIEWVLYTGGNGMPRPMWQPPFFDSTKRFIPGGAKQVPCDKEGSPCFNQH
ncbi:hypothetical protein MRX96_056747 [Rhipicephalus microplus]